MTRSASDTRFETGLGLLLGGTIPIAALSYSIYRESQHTGDRVDRTGFGAGVVTSLLTLGLASYFLTTPWSEERLYDAFAAGDYPNNIRL